MSMSDTTENDVLEMICKGTDPSWRAGATGYWALFTADPGESGSLAAECNYTGNGQVVNCPSYVTKLLALLEDAEERGQSCTLVIA